MSGPWEKYQSKDSQESKPWENFERKKSQTSTAVRQGLSGATAGFLDEASGAVEALGRLAGLEGLGGSFSDVRRAEGGPTLDTQSLKDAYQRGRDRKREMLAQDREDYPITSTVAELAGGFASPANKVVKGMSAVKGGAALGGLYGLGNSESDDLAGMAFDTTTGAILGAGGGKIAEKAAPYIEKGLKGAGQSIQNAKANLGQKLGKSADEWAFKSTGAMLKDFRNADARGEVNKIGRWLLDKGLKSGQSVDDVAALGAREKEAAALLLDEVYNKAGAELKGSGLGFDPLRDKSRIMSAAKAELGDSVGGEGVLNQLSNYIDDLAIKHGDAPNEVLRKQFQADVNKYKKDYRNFLKERTEYRKAFGQAADDSQQVLQGFHDDSQRTASRIRDIEVNGQPANNMSPEGVEYGTQMGLFDLPQAPRGQFNPARGADDLLPLRQQMAMDDRSRYAITNLSNQGEIAGTGLVPRTVRQVDDVGVAATGDQLRMNFQPVAPQRPVRPAEVRNPMAPRRANEIKGAFDDQINYSRNPLTNEPNKEKVFSGARRELNNIILESIDSIDDKALGDTLRQANADYGMASKVSRIANDRVQRENANKFFGLTDNITGVGGVVASLMTGTPLAGIGLVAIKKIADKYGATTTAVALDALSKRLLREPQMQRLAQINPREFNATVIRLFETMDARNQLRLPKAADKDAPKKGPEKWVNDGAEKLNSVGIPQEEIERLRQTKEGRDLLIEASDASPNSKRMEAVLRRLRASNQEGGY